MGLKRLVHFKVMEMKDERMTCLAEFSNPPTHKLINFKNENIAFVLQSRSKIDFVLAKLLVIKSAKVLYF